MYPEELVRPMKQQLVDKGFKELLNEDDVNTAVEQEGTVLVVLNSVCGCAAGSMRPGVIASLDNSKLPSNLTTVFAGVDKAAVDQAIKFMLPYPPSSPSIGLFKDGALIHFIERHHIEGRSADMIAENLKMAYDEYC
jgi:putative YphP/YqiW family bacilliredoxin